MGNFIKPQKKGRMFANTKFYWEKNKTAAPLVKKQKPSFHSSPAKKSPQENHESS